MSAPLELEGAHLVDEADDEAHFYTTLHGWQLRAVADGRVPAEAVVLWHCLQTFGRKNLRCLAGNALLAKRLGYSERSVRRHLAALVEAGWVTVYLAATSDGGTRRTCVLHRQPPGYVYVRPGAPPTGQICPPTGQTASTDRPNLSTDRPDLATEPRKRTKRREPRENPLPSLPKGEGASDPVPAAQSPTPKQPASWATDLARELLEVYPHAVTESGRVRRCGPTHLARRLVLALGGLPADQREAVRAEILRAAQLEARARPLGSEDRKFSKGVDVWVNQRGWEAPAEVVGGGSPVVQALEAGRARAARERAERHKADPTRTPVPPEAYGDSPEAEAARRRWEQLQRERAEQVKAAVAARGGPAALPPLLADALSELTGGPGKAPAEPAAASGPAPAAPGASPPARRAPGAPRRPGGGRARAEVLAELEAHRRAREAPPPDETTTTGTEEVTRAG